MAVCAVRQAKPSRAAAAKGTAMMTCLLPENSKVAEDSESFIVEKGCFRLVTDGGCLSGQAAVGLTISRAFWVIELE